MHIRQVKTAYKVGEIVLNKGKSKKLLDIIFEDGINPTDKAGRVYLLVVDGIIKKIGGSVDKGGIKATTSFYLSANQGRPSIRSFGIMLLMARALVLLKKVEVYMISSQQVQAPVPGLFEEEVMPISAFKEMESKCIHDFKSVEGQFPAWNFQERGEEWASDIREAHNTLRAEGTCELPLDMQAVNLRRTI